jgi:hypothetical protein
MPASAARVESNRRNSLKSTGPKTPEGKAASRGNALKHGLCSTVVGLEDPEDVQERAETLGMSATAPEGTTFGSWLALQVASLSLRIENAQAMQQAAQERIRLRAELIWEDDRKLEAAILGEQLSRRPEPVLERLRQTPQGCEWLLGRWALLAHAAPEGQAWTPDQETLAFDLLGTPPGFREAGLAVDWSALIAREVADLERRIEIVQELDEADRQWAESGLIDDPELRRLRRYEASLHRQMQWSLKLLQAPPVPQPGPKPTAPGPQPEPQPGPEPGPEPGPQPGPQPEPDPEPAPPDPEVAPSTGRAVAPPSRSAARAEKKLIKAEARREARSRKLEEFEKLRA